MANVIKTVLTYQLDGSNRDFNIPFEYLARKFVVVTLIGVDRKVLTINTDYRFATRTTISLTKAWGPADGYTTIELRRVTSTTDRLVDFTDGSILRAYDLNVAQIQTMHVAEEARDLTADTIGVNNDGHLDARGRRIVNLANAVDDRDAVPLGQLKVMNQNSWQARNEALQFRNEAETFRNQAEGFKNESSTNATNTNQWRNEAKGFRDEAEQFKSASGQYADAAGSYAGNAKDSEDEARRIAASIRAAGLFGYITRRSFEKGFNVTVWNEVLLWEEDGEYYRWDGTLPKNVPAGSTPETSGGIGLGAWVSVGEASLRSDLSSSDGAGLIGVNSGGTVQDSLSDIKNSIKHAQPLSDRRIIAIAHRGYSETYLEQTLMAYSQCNTDVLEVDMQTTSDGYAVCFHDNDLSPATVGGYGAVKDNTFATVSALRFTRTVGTRYADMVGIPTLGSVCRIAMRRGKMIHAEIKGYRTLADCALYSSIINQYGLSPYTTFSCFDFAPLAYTHNINPRITYALELNSYDSGMDANIAELASWGGSVLSINKDILSTIGNKKLREWEAMGLTLAAWTVYTAEQMQTVANYGIRLIYLDKDFYNIIG